MSELERIRHDNDLIEISIQEKRKHDDLLSNELEKLQISIGIKDEDIIACKQIGKSLSEKSKETQTEITQLQNKVKAAREKLECLEERVSSLENENKELFNVSKL